MGFTVMALLQVAISAAYLIIAITLVPRLQLAVVARVTGLAFFLLCAASHFDFALHTLTERPPWALAGHAWVIHGTQALADWVFLISTRRYRVELLTRWRQG